jgi:hypothetical protein
MYIKDFKMKHIKQNLFEIKYTEIKEGEIYVEHVIDPDDDGNSPIKLGSLEYVVTGRLAKTAVAGQIGGGKVISQVLVKLTKVSGLANWLLDDDDDSDVVAKKIIEWYNKEMSDNSYFKMYIKDFKMKHITKNLFEIQYTEIKEGEVNAALLAEQVADPDRTASSMAVPIKLGSVYYSVYGRLVDYNRYSNSKIRFLKLTDSSVDPK